MKSNEKQGRAIVYVCWKKVEKKVKNRNKRLKMGIKKSDYKKSITMIQLKKNQRMNESVGRINKQKEAKQYSTTEDNKT